MLNFKRGLKSNLFVVSIISILIFKSFFTIYYVPTNSMFPSVQSESFVLVIKHGNENKIINFISPKLNIFNNYPFYIFNVVIKGDIIVFLDPVEQNKKYTISQKRRLIKRCIAFSQDTIYQKINLNNIEEKFEINFLTKYKGDYDSTIKRWALPDLNQGNGCFVVGDNYLDSFDSRHFGIVSEELIQGKVIMKIWPWPPRRLW